MTKTIKILLVLSVAWIGGVILSKNGWPMMQDDWVIALIPLFGVIAYMFISGSKGDKSN